MTGKKERPKSSIRKGVIEQMINEVNQLIKEFEHELVVLHDELDPESDKDLREIMRTQEQLDTYYELKGVYEQMLKKGE